MAAWFSFLDPTARDRLVLALESDLLDQQK